MTPWKKTLFAGLALFAILAVHAATAIACPFCGAVKSTFAQEIKAVDVAVVARLVAVNKRPEAKEGELNLESPTAKFEIVEVLKGAELVGSEKRIEVVYFEDFPVGSEFLIEGALPAPLAWTPPVKLTARSHKYLSDLMKFTSDSPARLIYLMDYLGDKEELLASDAYDEFALAPYAALQAIKDKMPHDELVRRVQDPEVVPSRRRLYLTMLGVCGNAQDLPMLEALLRVKDPKFKAGLDATVACYLVLRGADGLPFIEDLFLKKETDEYTDIYSVVMALRILGQEKNGPIPQDRIVQSMRMVLDHPRVADQAIMDLARWQDWTVMDRLVGLFKSSDPEVSSWVRVPVINYLRACPLPKAKEYIAELRKIDPKSVRQSETLYPIGPAVQIAGGQPPAAATRATSEKGQSAKPATGASGTSDSSEPAAVPSNVPSTKTSSAAPGGTTPGDPASRDVTASLESRSWYIIIPAAILGAIVLAFVARGPRNKELSKID